MANSEGIEARLCAYIEGDLDPAQQAEIERHLAAHPAHRQMIEDLIRTRGLLSDLPRAKAPVDIADGLQNQLERSMLLGDCAAGADIHATLSDRIRRAPHLAVIAAVGLLAVGLGSVVSYLVHAAAHTARVDATVAMVPPAETGVDKVGDKGAAEVGASSGASGAAAVTAASASADGLIPPATTQPGDRSGDHAADQMAGQLAAGSRGSAQATGDQSWAATQPNVTDDIAIEAAAVAQPGEEGKLSQQMRAATRPSGDGLTGDVGADGTSATSTLAVRASMNGEPTTRAAEPVIDSQEHAAETAAMEPGNSLTDPASLASTASAPTASTSIAATSDTSNLTVSTSTASVPASSISTTQPAGETNSNVNGPAPINPTTLPAGDTTMDARPAAFPGADVPASASGRGPSPISDLPPAAPGMGFARDAATIGTQAIPVTTPQVGAPVVVPVDVSIGAVVAAEGNGK